MAGHRATAIPSARREVERFWEKKQRRRSHGGGEVVLLALVQRLAPQPHDALQLVCNSVFLVGELAGLVRRGTGQLRGWAGLWYQGGGKKQPTGGDVRCELPLVTYI